MNPQTRRRLAGLCVLVSCFSFTAGLRAQSATWTAPGDGAWSSSENWAGGAPANGADAIATFSPKGTSSLSVANDLPALTLGGITIGEGASRSTTITGGDILLQSSSGTPTIQFAPSGSAAGLTISSTLSGTQGLSVTNAGNHRLQINGNNRNLKGPVTINSGTIVLGHERALGTGHCVVDGGVLNAGSGRAINNDIVWNRGYLTMDTNSGAGPKGGTFSISGEVTLNAASGNLVASSIVPVNTHFFSLGGRVTGGAPGSSLGINLGNGTGNLYVTFSRANSFAHNIAVLQGGAAPASGLGKHGSVGIFVGDDSALSAATVTLQPGVHRFVLASMDGSARNLSNNFVWHTNDGNKDTVPAYNFIFGAYAPVGPDYLTSTPVGSVGGSGDIGIGNLDVSAVSGIVPTAHRRIHVTGSTTATIKGVFSRSGSTSAARIVVEKIGSGTLVLANAENTFNGGVTVSEGVLKIDGLLGGTGVGVASGAAVGGDGTLAANLHLFSYAGFVFGAEKTLTVNGAEVTFDGFGVSNLLGLDSKVAEGTYTLIDGTAKIVATGLSNVGQANAADLGGGKAAYLQIKPDTGDLQVVVFRRRS